MATIALILSAIAATASVAALIGVFLVRSEVRKLRRQHISSEKMYWDSRLGVYASRPEDLQRYRDSIAATTENALPNS